MKDVRPMLLSPLAALACLFIPHTALAYPISPVPLWDLTEEAELIVLGDVKGVEETKATEDPLLNDATSSGAADDSDWVAHISVREVWKGEAGAQVDVSFDPRFICPAPPRYVAGKLVAAFLTSYGETWFTVGLSYGTLYPAAGEIGDFRDRVREAVELQESGEVDPRERIAWLVRAAARPATRWHGLYGLKASGDSLHYYYDAKAKAQVTEVRLTAADYDAITRGFIEQPSVDRTLPMVLALFEGRPHHGLDRAAIAAIEGVLLNDTMPWWIGEALERLLTRLGDADPKGRLQPLGERYDDKPARLLREIWAAAKRDLYLPEIPAAAVPAVEVWGTGENTPS